MCLRTLSRRFWRWDHCHEYADVCWHILTYADVCWRMRSLSQVLALGSLPRVCWRTLTYADVCWHMLTYADVCALSRRFWRWDHCHHSCKTLCSNSLNSLPSRCEALTLVCVCVCVCVCLFLCLCLCLCLAVCLCVYKHTHTSTHTRTGYCNTSATRAKGNAFFYYFILEINK
jgi:hypothetical protein